MATKDYSQLTAASDVQDGDLLATFRGTGPLKKLTAAQYRNYLATTFVPAAGGTMTGALAVYAGTEALPGLAFAGDLNTGWYWIGADQAGFSTGGAQRFMVSSAGIAIAGDGAFIGDLTGAADTLATARTIQITGDAAWQVSFDGSGNVSNALTIANGAVSLGKIANAAANSKLLGSGAAGAGAAYVEIALGTGLSMAGNTLNASTSGSGIDQLTGDVTAGPGSGSQAATIANGAVSLAKMANIATDRLIGRDSASTGVPEALTVGNGLEFTGSGGIGIANDGVTYARMQNVSAASRLVGRGAAAGAGDPEEISLGAGLSMSGTTLSATVAPTQLGSSAASGGSVAFTSISGAYNTLWVVCDGLSLSNPATVSIEYSTNNGGAYNTAVNLSTIGGGVQDMLASLQNYSGAGTHIVYGMALSSASVDATCFAVSLSAAINAVRISVSGETFDAGTIYLMGAAA